MPITPRAATIPTFLLFHYTIPSAGKNATLNLSPPFLRSLQGSSVIAWLAFWGLEGFPLAEQPGSDVLDMADLDVGYVLFPGSPRLSHRHLNGTGRRPDKTFKYCYA